MKKINDFINSGLAERLVQLDRLTAVVENHLGKAVQNRIWPLLRNRRLLLLTDDPYLATQARFMQKTLCQHVNKELDLKLNGVDIKLISLPLASFGKKTGRTQINTQTAQTLTSIAHDISDDELRQALLRIAAISQTPPSSTSWG